MEVIQLLLIAGVGTVMYWMLRAMNMRPLAEIAKLSCYALAIANIIVVLAKAYKSISEWWAPIGTFLDRASAFFAKFL